MRFLVVGASGFIGSRLSHELAKRFGMASVQLIVPPVDRHPKEQSRRQALEDAGFEVVRYDIMSHPPDILKQVKPFDVLMHLATFAETESNDKELDKVNDVGTDRLLENLKPLLANTRVVFTSSLAAVDRAVPENAPQNEESVCTPRTRYGRSKLRAESILKRYAEATPFEWTILRLPTVFGPGYRPGGLFDQIAESLRRGTLVARLAWPGRIGLVYVDDVVNALIALASHEAGRNALYVLSSGVAPTLDELNDQVAAALGLRRRRLQLPGFVWALMRRFVWLPGVVSIPIYSLHNLFWRLSLILIDGMVGDGRKLNSRIPLTFTSLEAGLRGTFSDAPERQVANRELIEHAS
jgi:nucleoside-diphosphate-sugar epimerase